MKLFFSYLYSKRLTLISCVIFAAIFTGALALYQLPLAAVLYPAGICMLLSCGVICCDFLRVKKQHAQLSELKVRVETVIDLLPDPHTLIEADYQALVDELCNQAGLRRGEDHRKYRDMVDYYTVWAHQIKTPISAMKLSLQNEDTPLSRRLETELLRIEQYVEMVLAFLRLGSDSSDYVFRDCALDPLIRSSVRRFAGEFIGRKLQFTFTPTGYHFVTDEKWLSFVIEQLLSNALKYTRSGGITIEMKQPGVLRISDTGIGIAPEDLPRIFEKGFSGYNGRAEHSSTGIGLYLCSRVCSKLGIGLSAVSEIGVGTSMELNLQQIKSLAE